MQQRVVLALVVIAACMPLTAAAAGFASQSLFLSKDPVTEGDSVQIHAVVSNDAASKFTGSLTFTEGEAQLGKATVSLAGGESAVVSAAWSPTAGSHTINATLRDSLGSVVGTEDETFTINAKPKPASTDTPAAAVESSAQIQHSIESVSPTTEKYAQPVFSFLDSARSRVADVIDNQLNSTKPKLGANPGAVLSAEQTKNAGKDPVGAVTYVLNTLYFYILTILRFIIGSAAVFYPVFAIAFLWALWKTFRRFRRPAY